MNTSSPSAWQQITPQSTHGFRKDAWVIPYGPSVPLQGLLVLSRKFSAQPARFPLPPPLSCSSGDGYKHLLICLLHSSQNLRFKMQIQSGYFLAKALAAFHRTWGTIQIGSPRHSFLQAFCCGDEARPHVCASLQRSHSGSRFPCKSSHRATTTQLGAAPHLAVTYSGGFAKGLSLRLVFVSSLPSSCPHKIRRKGVPSLLRLCVC